MKTRKELKEEYKRMKFRIGVFQIKNNINGKIYIGSSLDLVAIKHSVRLQLDVGSFPNDELQSDWKKYGADNFSYEIIDELKQKDDEEGKDYRDDLKVFEAMIIDDMQPFGEKGYNKRKMK